MGPAPGEEGPAPPRKRICVGSLIAGPVLKAGKARRVGGEEGKYAKEESR